MLDLILAVTAGALTVAAPCILPMLPILFGASIGRTSRNRPLFITLGFVLSFSAVGLVFGAFSSALGLSQTTLRNAAIVMLATFGGLMIWPRPFEWLATRLGGVVNRAAVAGERAGHGPIGGLVLGMTLGVVWTPCAGPVLGSILTLVATARHLGHASVLLLCYALGAGIPMLGIAYGGQYISTRARRLAHHSQRLQQVFGVLVILISLTMYFQYDSLLAAWLSGGYPHAGPGL